MDVDGDTYGCSHLAPDLDVRERGSARDVDPRRYQEATCDRYRLDGLVDRTSTYRLKVHRHTILHHARDSPSHRCRGRLTRYLEKIHVVLLMHHRLV